MLESILRILQGFLGVALLHVADQGVNDRDAEDNRYLPSAPSTAVSHAAAASRTKIKHVVKVGQKRSQPACFLRHAR